MSQEEKVEAEVKEEEVKEETPVEEPKEEVKEEDVMEKIKAEFEKIYKDIVANLSEREKENFPSFEEWFKDRTEEFKLLWELARRRQKMICYPLPYPYPYYPYPYYGYPPPEKGKEEQGTEETEEKAEEEVPESREEVVDMEEKKEIPEGSGIVESVEPHRKELEKIVESLKAGSLREQWHPEVVPVTTKELTGHLRDYCIISNVTKGKAGDSVDIAYVKDMDFEVLSTVGASFSGETSGLVGSVSTTLKEAGFYTTIKYSDIEKLDANLLEELENRCRTAALRAEDKVILDTLNADNNITEIDHHDASSNFDADWVAEGIAKLMAAGKQVNPGDCVLVLTPAQYEALLKDVAGSMGLVFARPDVIQKGRITEFMGVDVVVVPKANMPTKAVGGTNYKVAYLIMKNRAVVFAPKRELLIETERLTKERKVQLTATHTFGCVVIDSDAAVEIITPET